MILCFTIMHLLMCTVRQCCFLYFGVERLQLVRVVFTVVKRLLLIFNRFQDFGIWNLAPEIEEKLSVGALA